MNMSALIPQRTPSNNDKMSSRAVRSLLPSSSASKQVRQSLKTPGPRAAGLPTNDPTLTRQRPHRQIEQSLTHPLLRQLPSPLILAVSQQLDNSSFVRCKSSHFLHDLTDEGGSLGEMAFGAGDAGFGGEGGGFLDVG
jgi:hypothetical protein